MLITRHFWLNSYVLTNKNLNKLIDNKLRRYKVETPRIELGSKQAAKRLSTYVVFS